MKEFWKKLRAMIRTHGKVNTCIKLSEMIEENVLFFDEYKVIFDDETSTVRIYSGVCVNSVGIIQYEDIEAHLLMTSHSAYKYNARRSQWGNV